MFPINLLIVSIFRNTRPRERRTDQTPKQPKTDSVKQGKTGRVSPTQPPSPQSDHREITPDAVVKVHKSTLTGKKKKEDSHFLEYFKCLSICPC